MMRTDKQRIFIFLFDGGGGGVFLTYLLQLDKLKWSTNMEKTSIVVTKVEYKQRDAFLM